MILDFQDAEDAMRRAQRTQHRGRGDRIRRRHDGAERAMAAAQGRPGTSACATDDDLFERVHGRRCC